MRIMSISYAHTHIYIYNIKAFGDDKVIQVATVSQVTQPMPKHGGENVDLTRPCLPRTHLSYNPLNPTLH